LREGIDASSSTVRLEIDPGSLTPEQRGYLAECLEDGHSVVRKLRAICPPTVEGLLQAVDLSLREREAEQAAEAAAAARAAEAAEAAEAAIRRDLLEAARPENWVSHTDSGFTACGWRSWGYQGPRYVVGVGRIADTDPAAQIYAAAVATSGERRREAAEAAKAVAEREAAEREAAERARDEELLPPALLARYRGGYATTAEVHQALSAALRARRGLVYIQRTDFQQVSVLTDAQFARLREVEASDLPDGAQVVPGLLYSQIWRAAEDDEDADKDGEVLERYGEVFVAKITWTEMGVEVVAHVALDAEALPA
jgi:hypothetical protein